MKPHLTHLQKTGDYKMKLTKKLLIALIFSSLTVFKVNAASITLKDGRNFDGEIKSQNSEQLVVDINGVEMTIPIQEISAIDLTEKVIAAEDENVNNSQTIEAETTVAVAEIEAGRSFAVKISDGFNSRHHKTGQRFTGILETNLISGDVIVASKGSSVYGVLTEVKKAGRVAGAASLSFELTEISIDGTMHAVKTAVLSGEGDNTAKSTAGKTARAAAIGGLAGGSSGAKTGAKVGVGASILSQGSDIEVPNGALIDFTLTQSFTPS